MRTKDGILVTKSAPPHTDSVQDAPFFTVKLQVKVLPCILMFLNGVAVDRVVGFEEFGAKDDFPTSAVERRLLRSGVISVPQKRRGEDSDDDDLPEHRRAAVYGGKPGADDEDSDFD